MRFAPIIALGVASLAFAAEGDTEVLDLTASDFDAKVNSENLILVEFFAPWCGHCKALAPHYDEASIALKEKGIKLAKVDCVDNAELCQEHGVSGYPTLKIFKNGTPTDYQGPRKADGIVSYMIKQSLPAATVVTAANFEEFKKADKMVVVAFLKSESDSPASEFKAAADSHRDDYLFGYTTDEAVIKSAGVTAPAIVLYRTFDEPEVNYAGAVASATSTEIANFLTENQMPLLGDVNQETYSIYAQSGLPLAYFFSDPEDLKLSEHLATLKPIAKTYRGLINFVTIDAVKFVDHGKALGLDTDKFPAFIIQDMAKQHKFPLPLDQGLSSSAISKFVKQFVDGKVEPSLKSEPVPESQDESVYTLVGKNFDDVVFDDQKDVFVEFYAPWCGHCKRLKPIWDSLADRYISNKDKLVIAKMDATENDLPLSVPFRVSGFPTLKFKPAGSKDFVDYDGDRSLESLIEFVEAQAKNKLDVPPPVASPKVEAEPEAAQVPLGEAAHDEL